MKKKEADIAYKNGKEALRNHEYSEAVDYFEESVQISPDKYAYFFLGEALGKLNKHDKALEAFDKTYELISTDKETEEHVTVLRCKAEESRNLENFAKAREYLDLASKMAERVLKDGKLEDAREDIEAERRQLKNAESQVKTRHLEALFKEGEDMERRKSYREAIEVYTRCLAESQALLLYFHRGRCHQSLQQFVEAISDLKKCEESPDALREDKLLIESYFWLGICFAEVGEFKLALARLKKAFDRIKSTYTCQSLLDDVIINYKMIERRMMVSFAET